MAEIVGTVASGISIGTLVLGVTSSIVKLKSYLDQVHDAPNDIKDLIEELEDLGFILADMEDQQRYTTSCVILDSTSISRSLQQCKRGLDHLKDTTVALSADLDASSRLRRKWGSAKVVLKKAQLDRYRVKLERAITLLNLSHQSYTRYAQLTYLLQTYQGLRATLSLLVCATCYIIMQIACLYHD